MTVSGSDKYLYHYGIERKSGRYPWGSGEDPYQRSGMFFSYINDLKSQGLTPSQIASVIDAYAKERGESRRFSTTQLRATNSIAKNRTRAENQRTALKLKRKRCCCYYYSSANLTPRSIAICANS